MTFKMACIQNSNAINLLSIGSLEEAIAEWKAALSSIKKVVDSNEAIPDDFLSMHVDASMKIKHDTLVPIRIDFEGVNDEYHTTAMFCKVFTLADNNEQEDENLLVAMLLYNTGVAHSLYRHECSEATRILKLYRLSLQILLDSGLMWHPCTTLLLMALYNNTAHIAFCAHEICYAVEALQELSVLLADDTVRSNFSSTEEDLEFFHRNTIILANEMSISTSPAA